RLPTPHEARPRPRAGRLRFRGRGRRELGTSLREDLRPRGDRPALRYLRGARGRRDPDAAHAAQHDAGGSESGAAREHRRGAALLPEPDGDAEARAAGPRLSAGAAGADRTRDHLAEPASLHPRAVLVLRPGAGDLNMRVVGRIALVLVLAIAQGAWAQIRLEGVDLSGGEDEAAQQKEEESAGSLGLDLR